MIFIDGNLPRSVADELKKIGKDTVAKIEIFEQDTKDPVWLRKVGQCGWLGITRDAHIRSRPGEVRAIVENEVGCWLFAPVRGWGRPLAIKIVGRGHFERFSGAFDDEKEMLLSVVMLVPFVPDDVAVASSDLSRLSFFRFVVLVALGRLPGWALTAFAAAYRGRLESWLMLRVAAGRGQRCVSRSHPAP